MAPCLEELTKAGTYVEVPATRHKTNDTSSEEAKKAHTLIMLNHMLHEKRYREVGDEKGPRCNVDIDTALGEKLNLTDAAEETH